MKVTKAAVNKQLVVLNKLFEGSKYRFKLEDAYRGIIKEIPVKRLMLQMNKKDYQSMGIWEVAANNSYLNDISTVIGSMVIGIEWYKSKDK